MCYCMLLGCEGHRHAAVAAAAALPHWCPQLDRLPPGPCKLWQGPHMPQVLAVGCKGLQSQACRCCRESGQPPKRSTRSAHPCLSQQRMLHADCAAPLHSGPAHYSTTSCARPWAHSWFATPHLPGLRVCWQMDGCWRLTACCCGQADYRCVAGLPLGVQKHLFLSHPGPHLPSCACGDGSAAPGCGRTPHNVACVWATPSCYNTRSPTTAALLLRSSGGVLCARTTQASLLPHLPCTSSTAAW
jgi:hypothetical protein